MRSPAASAWSTSTSCSSRSCRSPTTSSSARRRWPTRSSSTGRRPIGASSSCATASASRSTRRREVDALSIGWQQRVEILKALYRQARILVLDEPTAVLTPQETKEIFAVLRRLAAEGHSIIFISHKLYEVLEIADRITVIRRGRVVGTRLPAETNEEDLAELMVGRNVLLSVDRGESNPAGTTLAIEDLHVADDRGHEAVKGVSFEVRAGEVLGVAGVAGNGQEELVEALTGLRTPTSGRVVLQGADVTGRGPRALQRAGMSFVPGDRHRFGLVLELPARGQPRPDPVRRGAVCPRLLPQRRRHRGVGQARHRGVRHPDAVAVRQRRDAVGWQPAEGGRRARVQSRPQHPRPRPADAWPGRRQHRVHPPPDRDQARRGCRHPPRLGRAR